MVTFEEWLGNQIDERNEIYAEVGQECYDNGYEQGRADYAKEISANFDDMDRTAYRMGRADGIMQGRAEAIDEALAYCNQNNDEKEECWNCCLSVWEDGQFAGCYLEQLKEQKE